MVLWATRLSHDAKKSGRDFQPYQAICYFYKKEAEKKAKELEEQAMNKPKNKVLQLLRKAMGA